jgi:CzcA family heavy metal efflux pump
MNWLISTALRQRILVVALAAVLLVLGIQTARTTSVDVFPEFAPPLVEIQTEAPGLSAEEVEGLVTVPLESTLGGVPWLKTIRSKSVLGLSSVLLIFEDSADLMRARQAVGERLAAQVGRLPTSARPPVILPPLSAVSRILKIGLWSSTLSEMEITLLAKWTVRPRLLAVPGVANVAIWGERDKQFQVRVDPDRLRASGVTLDAILRSAGEAAAVDSGGFVDTPNQRLSVRHLSPARRPEDLAQTVVAFRHGAAIRLGDVAEVVVASPPPIGDAVVHDRPGLLLIVEKHPWANTLTVTHQVEAALEALRPALEGVELDPRIFRPATFIERSVQNLTSSLIVGCLLVIVILAAFLAQWRTAVISLTAIPLSLAIATVLLHYAGVTMNTMVLAGLAIAVGEVVDDAIIDVENIVRRLRLDRAAGGAEPSFRVVLAASLEVRSAVVYASLIVALVFLPVFLLDGLAGSFFRPLALAYVLAILASLLVALTVTPAMSLLLLPNVAQRQGDPVLVRALKRWYRAALKPLLSRPRWVLGGLAGTFALTGVALSQLGEEFLPDFRETDFLMHWVGKPGTSLEAMRRVTLQVNRELRAVPGVRSFGAHIGRAEAADEVVGPNFAELWLSLDPEADYETAVGRIREVVEGYPGLFHDVLTYLKERIKEVLTGASATIVVRIFGPDLTILRERAREVAGVMAGVPGVTNLKVEPLVQVPQIEVRLRLEAAARFGLTPGQVRRAATTLVRGTKVGELYEDQKVFDVVVWGAPHLRTDLAALRAVPIDTPTGLQVPLGDVAELAIVPAPNEIKREGASRRIDVTCNVRGRDLGSVAQEIGEGVRALEFGREYHPELLGEYAAREASQSRLRLAAVLALLGVLVLLYVDFKSIRLTLMVALTLPFALVGGVAGAYLTGGVLSLGSLVGFVTVLGIAARNGILLVSHYRHLESEEGQAFGTDLVLRGAEERLAPILMTALATALALVPLVVRGNVPGHEIEHPMAVVIVGGLVTSTVLNLLLVPVLYAAYGKKRG